MEPFDLRTKIRRYFKCILWLEDYDDLGDLFKGHLGCCRSSRSIIGGEAGMSQFFPRFGKGRHINSPSRGLVSQPSGNMS